ncbi:MBG domain-containing protein [Mucilaginibacter terrae]|uniref:MBG domain-containing protein n=1 Tax=Mucilaginibacter terrae TaxID=1955052 RepID=UPI003628C85B
MLKIFTEICIAKLILFFICLLTLNITDAMAGSSIALKNTLPEKKWINTAAVDQTINFDAQSPKLYTDTDFDPGGVASSGLTVTYLSSNTAVATIIANKIHIVGTGTALITASQNGNNTYNRAAAVSRTLTVAKANLTVTASSQTRNYGVNNAAISLSFVGFKAGESVNQLQVQPRAVTTAGAKTNAGTYNVTVMGGSSNNYNFNYVSGSITINKITLTIAAVAKAKAYGEVLPALTVTYTGFVAGDNASKLTTTAILATPATVNSPAGSYAITVSGATSPNYNITQVNATLTVNKGNLTITAVAKTKVYATANPEFNYIVKGFVSGQTEAILSTPVVISTTATQNSPVGVYPITLSGATTANYNITYIQGYLTITKAALTISADAKTKVYGQVNPVLTINYTGFVNGENENVLTTAPIVRTPATQNSPTGAYNINVEGAIAANYAIAYITGKITITKATLIIAVNNQTRVYGSPNQVLTATYTGFVNGDSENNLTLRPAIATTANAATKAGAYAITVKNALSTNYNLVYVNGTLNIIKATLTIKADNITRVYGSTVPNLTVTYTGFVNGETANNLSKKPIIAAPVTAKSQVGNYAISIAGAASLNYDIFYQAGTLTITKRRLIITAQNKVRAYGAVNPVLTVAYTGLANGDKAPGILSGAPVLGTVANRTSALGNYLIEVSGSVTAANYDIVFANGTLTVGKATIKVTVVNKAKVYGQPNPAFTLTYTGFVNGDNASVITTLPQAPTTIATAASPAGNYPITTTGGVVANNYIFTYVQGRLSINRASLNIVFDNKTKVYGQPNPVFTYTLNGFINGDTQASEPFVVAPQISSVAATAGAGYYTIRILGGYTRNYNLRSVNGFLTVNKANLVISAVDARRSYASANPIFTATYTGLVNGDTEANIATKPTFTTNATATSVPDIYVLNVAGAASPNYNITYTGAKLVITKRKLIVRAVNREKTYGDANPAFTVAYEGFANGDTEANLTTPATATTNVSAGTAAGKYNISPLGFADNKYEAEYVNGTITINKANLTVVAQNATRVYGTANPLFNITYTGFVNGDTEAVLTNRVNGTTTATKASGVGNYDITLNGGTAANYNFIYNAAGGLSITPATLTITVNDASRFYGAANPEFTSTYTGFVNGDTQVGLTTLPEYTTTANQLSGVGTYPITVSNAASGNYNILYNSGALAINKALLIAKADDKTKFYGNTNPEFTVSYTGFVNNETQVILTAPATAAIASDIDVSTLPGSYVIMPTGGSANNYQLSYTTGTFNINKADLLVTAVNASRGYGTVNPVFTVTYNGFVLGDTQASLTTLPAAATVATDNSPAGNYSIVATGGVSNKYEFKYVNGVLSISKAILVISVSPASRTYGAANPLFTPLYSGFVNGDTESSMTSVPTYTTNAIATSGVGQYSVTPFGAVNNNYEIGYNTGELTINKAQLIAKADDKNKTYGNANPAFTVSYTGFVNNETNSVLTTQARALVAAGIDVTTVPGNYMITPVGGSATNYQLSYNTGQLTIDKALLTVTANSETREYGAINPVFTVDYSGFVLEDTPADLDVKPTATTIATGSSPVGTYAIIPARGVSDKYAFDYKNGLLNIGKLSLQISAQPATKTYGEANPAFTPTYTGFINGDTEVSLTTKPVFNITANTASPVGTYSITPTGATSNNYSIVYKSGVLTVNKAQLNVIAEDKNKIYGSANPAFTIAYSGFVNGDTEAALISPPLALSAATQSSGAGTYAIIPTAGSAANYSLAYTNGTLTVNKAQLTITANNATRLFNEANPAFTVVYTGFVNGDTENSLSAKPVETTTATEASPVGTYALVPGSAVSANYNFNYVNGILIITSSTALINFALLPAKTFGDADFDPTATNAVNEPMVYTSSNTAVATILNGKIHIVGAGMATITAAFAPGSNYNQTLPVSQLFVVDRALQRISFTKIPTIAKGSSYNLNGIVSTSGLPVILKVSDPVISSLQGLVLTGRQIGNTTISAYQPGNDNYYPATTVVQNVLVVNDADGQIEIIVHQAVSPNGDGINDTFFIEGIANHPNNQVTIVNRNGLKVYEAIGYDNINRVFNGRSNVTNSLLQPGTYFYQIKYISNGKGLKLTGYFVLKY